MRFTSVNSEFGFCFSSRVPSRGDLEPIKSKRTKPGNLSGQNRIFQSVRLDKNHSTKTGDFHSNKIVGILHFRPFYIKLQPIIFNFIGAILIIVLNTVDNISGILNKCQLLDIALKPPPNDSA